MNDKITLGQSDEGSIDVDINKLVDSRMLIQGNSGGGKSYLLRLLCERAAGHVPIIILDTEGEFASLREKIDAILIGSDGEVPTDLRSAAILPHKLLELQVSAIIDLYELRPHERREYVRLFLNALINLPKDLWHPTLIVIDEAHKLCPEKGQGDAVSTQAVIDLMSLGRKRGYSGILATQRFSKLHNDAIAETNNVCIGRTWMDVDQKRAGQYLGLAAGDRGMLRELKPGEFYAFGPALSVGGIVKFKGDKVETSHPKPGERHTIKPTKPSDAIQQIVSQIADLPEVAVQEAKDLVSVKEAATRRETELKTQIFALEHRIKEADKPIVEHKERLVFPDEKIIDLMDKLDEFYGSFADGVDKACTAQASIESAVMDLRKAIPTPDEPPVHIPQKEHGILLPSMPKKEIEKIYRAINKPAGTLTAFEGQSSNLSKSERLVLRAFYWTRSDDNIKAAKIGFYSGYSHKSGGFASTLSSLRGKGLLVGMKITPEGEDLAGTYAEARPPGIDLREWLREKLNKCENEILDVLVANPGVRFNNEDLAGKTVTQYSHLSGGFASALSKLRSLEAAEGYGREGVKAADVFFE